MKRNIELKSGLKMSHLNYNIEYTQDFQEDHQIVLKEIYEKLKRILGGKREIMYSDIINLIIREGHRGEIYNQLIRWCNFHIRNGNLIIELY